MTRKEFCKLTGMTVTQVRYRCETKGTFSVPGFGTFKAVKTGKAKTARTDIRKVSDEEQAQEEYPSVLPSPLEEIKRERMRVDIELKRQRLRELRDEEEAEFVTIATAKLRQAMEPLKEAFRGCRLNEEQAKLINDALTECLRRLKQS